jgi:hypothetical protein
MWHVLLHGRDSSRDDLRSHSWHPSWLAFDRLQFRHFRNDSPTRLLADFAEMGTYLIEKSVPESNGGSAKGLQIPSLY